MCDVKLGLSSMSVAMQVRWVIDFRLYRSQSNAILQWYNCEHEVMQDLQISVM